MKGSGPCPEGNLAPVRRGRKEMTQSLFLMASLEGEEI